jgi:predicted ATPase/DNA-binding SARP family transcriptional activator
MSRLALHLFGSPRIELDGEPVQVARRKALALIVYLAVTGQSHSRDALATLLWSELDQSRARAGLRRALTALRKALGEGFLDVDREIVGLNPDAEVWLDMDEFQGRLAACWAHDHPEGEVCPACLPLLAEAAALYRDDFLAGFALPDCPAFDEFQFFQAEDLRTELASTLERLARAHGGQGEFDRAIAYARRWLALDPLHEPAHCHLMALYAQSGQRSAALRQYGECERVLREELGVSPEEETIQVYRAIEENRELPRPVSLQRAVRKHNLPVHLTPFVGRESALAEIKGHLQDPDCRLLTLVGPGGCGKTRLALKAAAAQLANYPHGVWFVSLAPLQSVEAIVPTVAEAVGFIFYEGVEPRQQLLDYLRQKNLLLIMDNYEHLLEGAGLVTEILKTAPDVRILTTSRERLSVQGERLFPVAGMAFPDWETPADVLEYSAVRLFVQSAQRACPDFELQGDDLRYVARICRLAEGMPLAILLAAGWVQMLTPREIAVEIGKGIDFLETDLRDVPERQRGVRAVFDHSWGLLTEREREVLQALSVFRGGFTRGAAQEITGVSLQVLMALANKSLLHRASVGRYELHELLRQYAAEKLDASPAASQAARDQHCAYYVAALEQWGEDLKGARQQAALREMDVEIENARAAWNWAAEQGQVERLDQAIDGLCCCYEWRGRYQEGGATCRIAADKLEPALSDDGPTPSSVGALRLLVKILTRQSDFFQALGHAKLASQLLQQSLALLERSELANEDTRAEEASILLQMGSRLGPGREKAKRLCDQSLALHQALGDRCGTADALSALGQVALYSGAYGEAKQLYEESLGLRQGLADQRGIASSLEGLASAAVALLQFEEGERSYRQSLAIYREMGDQASIANGLINLGFQLTLVGQFSDAHLSLEESVAICNELGNRGGLALLHFLLGDAKIHLGRYEQAWALGQMGCTLSREIGYRWGMGVSLRLLGCVMLAEEAYATARGLLQESVVVLQETGEWNSVALTLAVLGLAARGLGQSLQAQQHLSEALRTTTEIGAFLPLVRVLPAMALLLADRGEPERAVELYALASRYPFVANSRWFEAVTGRHIADVAATLPPEGVAVARERGRVRDLNATVLELLAELGG